MKGLFSLFTLILLTIPFFLSCEEEEQIVPVSSVSLSQPSAEMIVGESITLRATISPSNATRKEIIWASSKKSVASVDQNGKVVAIAAGTTTITALAGGKMGSCYVTVSNKNVAVSSITLDKTSASLKVGETLTLIATVKPDDATAKTVTWSTSDATVAEIYDGVVTAKKIGTATIKAKAGNKEATCSVTVSNKNVAVSSITLDKTSDSLKVGESITLRATISPSNATEKEIIWASSKQSVASVDQSGKVVAIAEGTTTITASAGGKVGSCSVTVSNNNVAVSSITLDKTSASLKVGETLTLIATVEPDDATDKTVTWSTTDATVAEINDGVVTAKKIGTATIKAKAGNKEATCSITVEGTPANETLVITARVTDYSEFTITVSTNSTKSYFFDVVEKNTWDLEGADAVWRSLFKKTGVTTGNGRKDYTNQKTMTEFVAFAAFCDANGVKTGDVYTEVFVTDVGLGGEDPSIITFSVSSLTETSFTLTASSVSQDKYYVDVVEKSFWDDYGAEAIWQAYVESELADGTFVSSLATGEVSYQYENLSTTQYVAFAAYCYNDGTLKSTIFYKDIDLTNVVQTPDVKSVSINTNLALLPGESRTMVANCYGDGWEQLESAKVTWSSSDPSIATVDENGCVKAVNTGIAIITALSGSVTDEALALVASDFNTPVDLGLSVKWAPCNIGASRPEGYGRYFCWGATDNWNANKDTSPYSYQTSWWNTHKDEVVDNNYNLYRTLDPANNLIGKSWRLPTKKEFEELLENCSVQRKRVNGKIGVLIQSENPGYSNKWIFIPHTGICWAWDYADPEHEDVTMYWSSTINNNAIYNNYSYETVWALQVNSKNMGEGGDAWINSQDRSTTGCPIRPVYTEEMYFDAIVSEISSNQSVLKVGTNSSDTYYINYVEKSIWDEYGADEVWRAHVNTYIANGTFANSLRKGDKSLKLVNLSSKTEYVVFAAFCDNNGTKKGRIYSRSFTTM